MEAWKPVVGNAAYEVSDAGQLRRVIAYNSTHPGRVLRQSTLSNGYKKVSLSHEGVVKDRAVHRLVAEAFLPNPDNRAHVNHINADRGDNRLTNLEWCTPAANLAHARALGRWSPALMQGAKNGGARLTEDDVRRIRALWAAGVQGQKIAAQLGFDRDCVYSVARRRTWKHLP
jgi:hypothetical protein